ncbi:MAG: DUF4020 domain-containing protein [Bdellovibrionaceae bacterium]|nr:DUF4020 domain-containing protein [Pseudobdellovibrionaceae bacterium]
MNSNVYCFISFPLSLLYTCSRRHKSVHHISGARRAGICIYAKINPNNDNWLNDFLVKSNDEDRATFANQLKWTFRNSKTDVRKSAWNSWIINYWIDRDAGRPIKFSDREKVTMIEMALLLENQMNEVVDFVISSPSPKLNTATKLFSDLEKDGYATNHPKEILNLLLHLLPNIHQDFYICFALEPVAESLIDRLSLDSTNRNKLIQLCEHLARYQCPKAIEFRSKFP